jgi:putative spermidine/putrescine transport system ATP-binding protein
MAEGEIRQVGSQRDLYERPADRFVAGFVGRSTFLPGRITAPGWFETAGGIGIACRAAPGTGPATLALRPEAIRLDPPPETANRLTGMIEFLSYLGPLLELHVRLSVADRLVVHLPNHPGLRQPALGDSITLGWPRETGMIFPDHP